MDKYKNLKMIAELGGQFEFKARVNEFREVETDDGKVVKEVFLSNIVSIDNLFVKDNTIIPKGKCSKKWKYIKFSAEIKLVKMKIPKDKREKYNFKKANKFHNFFSVKNIQQITQEEYEGIIMT